MRALRRRSCPATARSPICSGRMTHPAPLRPSPVPSISRLFAAAFLAIAVAGLAERVAIWRSARRTQADMIELSQRLEQLARVSPSPALEPEIVAMRELAAEVGDNAIQAAAQTTVIFVIVLVALGVGLWYNRRRLATPFAHVVGALQRVAAGRYEERLDEDQPEEFGTIARGVNQMAAALSWRERMQDQAGRLLSALNAPPREATAGGSFGPALDVIAGATGAPALALYQPQYDTNEWGPTAVRRATARPLSRDVVRQLVGDTVTVIYHASAAAGLVRTQLQLVTADADSAGGLALAPLRSQGRLVGLLVATVAGELSADARVALEHAAPNLAIACERESAPQHTRRPALGELVNGLPDRPKMGAGRMGRRLEPLEMGALLQETADTVRAQLEARRHTLVIEPLPDHLVVTADRGRLRQVLLNLLSNAIKFSTDGGRVTLTARLEDSGAVRVAVTDTGIGIAPADQRKLFQEFVQLNASESRRYEGTGLGLALSKRLVELHGEIGRASCRERV